jgi:putative copper resistance protein D
MSALRRSLLIETGLGLALIGVVAVMGTLPPPASL